MIDINEIWTIEDILYSERNGIEIGLEANHVLFLQKPKKYKHVKSNKVFYVYKINLDDGHFYYEEVFTKKRHAKKAYKKLIEEF